MDKNHAVWQYLQAVFKLNKWEDWQQIEVSHIIAMTRRCQSARRCVPTKLEPCATLNLVRSLKPSNPNGGVSAAISQNPEFIENANEP
jgi:hypothetical protein